MSTLGNQTSGGRNGRLQVPQPDGCSAAPRRSSSMSRHGPSRRRINQLTASISSTGSAGSTDSTSSSSCWRDRDAPVVLHTNAGLNLNGAGAWRASDSSFTSQVYPTASLCNVSTSLQNANAPRPIVCTVTGQVGERNAGRTCPSDHGPISTSPMQMGAPFYHAAFSCCSNHLHGMPHDCHIPFACHPPSLPSRFAPSQNHTQRQGRPVSALADLYDVILAECAHGETAGRIGADHQHGPTTLSPTQLQVQQRSELPLNHQRVPWTGKPRQSNPTGIGSPIEANAAPSKPMGLKHEESSTATPFIVDADFERAVQELVPCMDHPETPSLTVRVFFLGTLFSVALAFVNTLFSFRTNTFLLSPYVCILLAYPMGKFLERYVPDYAWYTRWFILHLNPGPFTVKEHVLIGIWSTTGASAAYGTSNLVVQELFYNVKLAPWACVGFLICLNLIGFGFSGLFRSWVIRPLEMIWPSVLPFVSLYSAFHGGLKRSTHAETDSVIDPKHKSKLRFFSIAIVTCLVYHIVGPQYMAAGIASIPLLCLLAPQSSEFWRMVVGSQDTGVGAFSLSLDWSLFGSLSMVTPFWVTASSTAGSVALQWVVTPLVTHFNWFNAPSKVLRVVNSLEIFDKNGVSLSIGSKLVENDNLAGVRVRWDVYEKLKPFHLTPFYAMSYFSSMAQFMSAFVHCIVWYGRDIWRRWRGTDRHTDGLDIHCMLINQYPDVPTWVYVTLLLVTMTATIGIFQFTAMAMPWYMTLLAIGFSAVACFPIAVVLATTGVQLYLNVVSQFILGLLMPGFPIMQMAFKSLAVSVGQQCMALLTDLKLGHYMKIPPRHVFITQVTASIVSATASYAAVQFWLQSQEHRDWITEFNDKRPGTYGPVAQSWSSGSNRAFYSASVIWGLIGPRRFFFETVYGPVLIYGLAFGALTPIVIKLLDLASGQYFPWKYVQGPLLFSGVIPGGDTSYVFTQFLVAMFFQFFMYRYRTNWWKRYNYIFACALDVGVALATFTTVFLLRGFNLDFPEWLLNPGQDEALQKRIQFCKVSQ